MRMFLDFKELRKNSKEMYFHTSISVFCKNGKFGRQCRRVLEIIHNFVMPLLYVAAKSYR